MMLHPFINLNPTALQNNHCAETMTVNYLDAKLRTMSTFLHLSYHFTPYRDILTIEGVKTNDKSL